jgi:hypothetical protein
MEYRLRMPLELEKLKSSATFYLTHMGHRENATDLAIKLIRRGARVERQEHKDDAMLLELTGIAENWAVGHIVQGCYIVEYHEWERGVKRYFKGQRELNGVSDDFDWRGRGVVKGAREALGFFRVAMPEDVVGEIDAVRERVNSMKHDPSLPYVNEADYLRAASAFKRFWERLSEIETGLST